MLLISLQGARTPQKIFSAFVFSAQRYVCCPHYTFELLSWVGYWALNGGDATSAFLFILSVFAMGPFASDRYAKYVRLFQDGQRDGGDPTKRWKMLPGLW